MAGAGVWSGCLALLIGFGAGCSRSEAPAEKAAAEKAAPAEAPAEKAAPAQAAAAQAAAEQPTVSAEEAAAAAAFRVRAQAATGALKRELLGALQAAMAEGPGAAVTACNTRAPAIAAAASAAGVKVGRTSSKLRNPANAPAPWLAPLLETYAGLPRDAAEPRVVALDGGHFGYVEPLYVGGLCVTCHGPAEGLPDEVKSRLAALYPKDAATGYEVGAFRGLVWATDR